MIVDVTEDKQEAMEEEKAALKYYETEIEKLNKDDPEEKKKID